MKTKRLFILVLLICLVSVDMWSARYDKKWFSLTNEQLIDRAYDFLYAKEKPDSALVIYTILINRLSDHELNNAEKEELLKAHINSSLIYCSYFYNLDRAYYHQDKALTLATEEHFNKYLSSIYTNYCYIYQISSFIQDSDPLGPEALNYLKKAFWSCIKYNDEKDRVYSVINITSAYICHGLEGKLEKEVNFIEKMKIKGDGQFEMMLRQSVAGLEMYCQGKYGEAAAIFGNIVDSFENEKNNNAVRLSCVALNEQYKCLLANSQTKEAFLCMNEIEQKAGAANMHDILIDIYYDIWKLYSTQGNSKLAGEYEMKYYREKDRLLTVSNIGKIDKVKFQNEIDEINSSFEKERQYHQRKEILLIAAGAIALCIIIFLLLLMRSHRRQKEYITRLYEKAIQELQDEPSESKQAAHLLSENNKSALLPRIQRILKQAEYTCSSDFSIYKLAELVGSNTSYVSVVINTQYGKSFKLLLTEIRIKEACRRMNNFEQYGKYTIDAIATEVGFKSRSAFSVAFKNITGISPSEFQKRARMANSGNKKT